MSERPCQPLISPGSAPGEASGQRDERLLSEARKERDAAIEALSEAARLLADLRKALDQGVFFLPASGQARDRGQALLDRLKAAGYPPHHDGPLPVEPETEGVPV